MLSIHVSNSESGWLQAVIDDNPPLVLRELELQAALQDLREQYPNHEITISEDLVDEL